jgi:uncharacterized membrane protein
MPLFPTQHEAVHFIKKTIARGQIKDCANLRLGGFRNQWLRPGPDGYGPHCERDSFRTEQRGPDNFDFYGCPPDCSLFEVQCYSTPWSGVSAAPAEETGTGSTSSGSISAAKITAAATIIAALIGAGWWTTKAKTDVEVKQAASTVETQQAQTQQNSPGGYQAGRDIVNIYQAPASPAPAPPMVQPQPQRPQVSADWRDNAPKNVFTFSLFDIVPAAKNTHPAAINDDGDVLGTYSVDGHSRRFLYLADRTMIYIDHPDGPKMYVSMHGLNNKREIVGVHGDSQAGRHGQFTHGFVRRADGKFESFDCLGSSYTSASAINNEGQIVGNVRDAIGAHQGFLRHSDGTCVALHYPEAASTLPTGINNKGEIVGMWEHPKGGGAFLRRRDGTFIPIQPPDRSVNLQPRAINDDGVIVGQAGGGGGGFMRLSNGTFLPLDHPRCPSPCTIPTSINNKGEVAGQFEVGNVYGFRAVLKPSLKVERR